MDFATIIGLIAGIAAIVWSVISSAGLNGVSAFLDFPSVVITIGGGICATLISYPLKQIIPIFSIAAQIFRQKSSSNGELVTKFLEMNRIVRKDGILSLEKVVEDEEDDFLRKSVQMAIDGIQPDIIKATLENDIDYYKLRHAQGQGIFETLAAQFPAWGMIGTLIGLILMLKSLDDPSTIGPSMAVAIITTFYGSILANFICNPIAKKIEIRTTEEVIRRSLIVEGVVSLATKDSPIVLEQKLNSFLSNSQKTEIEAYEKK